MFFAGPLALAVGILAAGEKSAAPSIGLPVGVPAPDFTLLDSTGQARSLTDFRGRKNVALVFYPALFRAGG